MIRALVTGATGFTGRYVTPLLEGLGFEVHGLSSKDCDIRDAHALRATVAAIRPHYVLHLAGTSNLPDSQADGMYSVNVQGTVNLLEACARLPEMPRKVILVSSCYVYGGTGSKPADENCALESTGAYGKSKREMEHAAAGWYNRLPILIVRPFNYTGVGHGDQFLVPKLVRLFQQRGSDASFVDSNVIRDYSDVRWVARVYANLLARRESSAVFNVCSGVGISLAKLVSILEQLTGHRVSGRPRAMDGISMVGSPARLLTVLGTPSPFSMGDTLRWMLAA